MGKVIMAESLSRLDKNICGILTWVLNSTLQAKLEFDIDNTILCVRDSGSLKGNVKYPKIVNFL